MQKLELGSKDPNHQQYKAALMSRHKLSNHHTSHSAEISSTLTLTSIQKISYADKEGTHSLELITAALASRMAISRGRACRSDGTHQAIHP